MPFFIKVSNLSYSFPNGRKFIEDISFSISSEKIGLTGDNGCGKTTLLRLISGELKQTSGSIKISGTLTKFEQDLSNLSSLEVVDLLGVRDQLTALKKITDGTGDEDDFRLLGDNWDIEQKISSTLSQFGLAHIESGRNFSSLSGGEAGRLILASCYIKNTDFILFDEPTNNLDLESREVFYDIIKRSVKGTLIVSHDRQLLRLMDKIIELSYKGIKIYGGNYDFYCEQKRIEENALTQKITNTEIELKKQTKLSTSLVNNKGKKNKKEELKKGKGGIPKIVLNQMRNNAEGTLSNLKRVHEQKIDEINNKLNILKNSSEKSRTIKLDLDNASKFTNRCLVKASELNYTYNSINLWNTNINFEIGATERVLISGSNGTGKTTLINLIIQKILPTEGKINVNCKNIGLVDQKYELLKPEMTVLENIRRFVPSDMAEHELRIRLARFLFCNDDVYKITGCLSGGEKSRLTMCCILAVSKMPELIILDELTNNLDLKSIEQIQHTLGNYKGALIVISHDIDFVREIGITKTIRLDEISIVSKSFENNSNKIINPNF
jgi:ATPase subunit of ABC transporter with duplicated ATPase domains